jgi:hypothetical protein
MKKQGELWPYKGKYKDYPREDAEIDEIIEREMKKNAHMLFAVSCVLIGGIIILLSFVNHVLTTLSPEMIQQAMP